MAAGYLLQLYCDNENPEHNWREFPHEYTGEHGPRCRALARRDGWRIMRDGHCYCPKCNKKEK